MGNRRHLVVTAFPPRKRKKPKTSKMTLRPILEALLRETA